jgi:hypothetical protein
MVWVLPMTSKEKVGSHYLKVGHEKGESFVNLSQIKTVSVKRFQRKIGMINEDDFVLVLKKVSLYLETSKPTFAGFSEAKATNNSIIAKEKDLSNEQALYDGKTS